MNVLQMASRNLLRNFRRSAVTITGVLGDVKASTVNGGIAASNLGGSARLRTVNGGVTADFDTLPPTARLKLETVNGGIKLRLLADAPCDVALFRGV